ncbi:serine hydrolase [Lactovum miscens]|uniref:Beta-lactamase class C n=1 Tax=Lactovum miscens TaxID=190387 RepID=A0A841C7W4_9LACT|nr:serine hydrolase [Lactovum miscens]MBB5887330.1 beta-lactamase class C [Lactovum miscens]
MLQSLKQNSKKTIEAIKQRWLPLLALIIFLLPAFFLLPKKDKVEVVKRPPIAKYLSVIPDRAISLKEIQSYTDQTLNSVKNTIKSNTRLSIADLIDQSGYPPVYKLSDGSFISANAKNVGSDVILSNKKISTTVYTTNTVNSLYSPFTSYDNKQYLTIDGNQALKTLAIATTHWGTYYEVSFDGGRTAWLDAKSVSLEDPKLTVLQKTLISKYGNNPNVSITAKLLDSKFTASVNSDRMIYSASLWKLAILYWTQKQILDGKASLSDQLKYVPEVDDTAWRAFVPSGTGSMSKTADDQMYSLQDLINLTAKESDNVASNMLSYYETGKFSLSFQTTINKLAGKTWSFDTRKANTNMVANVLNGLYDEGGAAFNSLFDTSYDGSRIEAAIPDEVSVAHKIGITDEENHDAAVVFTSQPYILVVMTTGNQPDSVITEISKTVYEVMK